MINKPKDFTEMSCAQCERGADLGFAFSMAFQPIVDIKTKSVYGYEALARGPNNEPVEDIFSQINDDNRYRFDQISRVKAIKLAADLNVTSYVFINFMPNAIYRPELCIRTTLEAAEFYHFPQERIILEFTEQENVVDKQHLQNIVSHFHKLGFKIATDDFGAGYAGLTFLANVQTDILKIDMDLIRDIHRNKVKQTILRGIMLICEELGIRPLVEGVETGDEYNFLKSAGIELYQGYFFAKPGFEQLPVVHYPD